MENVENRRTIHLFDTWANNGHKRGASNDISSGFLKRIFIFDENLIACELQKQIVTLDKPTQIGFMVLEASKEQMYDFHYGFMKKKYPNLNLLYMDTDSFVYDIHTKDFYKDLRELTEEGTILFDTSNYSSTNPYGILPVNAQVLGTMKDELAGAVMKKFIGLKAKCYAFQTDDNHTNVKAKGVQRKVASSLNMEQFEACLADQLLKIRKEMKLFKSDGHIIYTDIITKVALNGLDTKRFIRADGIQTLAWGHHQIDEMILEDLENNSSN